MVAEVAVDIEERNLPETGQNRTSQIANGLDQAKIPGCEDRAQLKKLFDATATVPPYLLADSADRARQGTRYRYIEPFCGSERRQRDLRRRMDYQKYRDAVSPLGKYMRHLGGNLEWLGGVLALIGIVSIVLGAGVVLIAILLAAGCTTALGGASLN